MNAAELSRIAADWGDLGWMLTGDERTRLERCLALLRGVVSIAFPQPVGVAWSSPTDPYEGVTFHEEPPRILLNPRHLLSVTPGDTARTLVILHGTALHEGSHAAFTPRDWGTHVARRLAEHARHTGRRLPESLALPALNWGEDVFIEDRLAQDYPYFRVYFEQSWALLLPPRTCRRRLSTVKKLLAEYRRDPTGFTKGAKLVSAVVNLLVIPIQCPNVIDEQLGTVSPEILLAARIIRRAMGEADVERRLVHGIEAVDGLFRYLAPFLPGLGSPPTGGAGNADHGDNTGDGAGGSPGARRPRRGGRTGPSYPPNESSGPSDWDRAADDIDRILKKRRKGWDGLHDRDDAAGSRPLDQRTLERLRTLLVTAGRARPTTSGDDQAATTLIDGRWTIRVVDSTPASLPDPPPEITTIAGRLLQEHRALASELRRCLRFRGLPVEQLRYGQRQGELDSGRLALVPAGARTVYFRREQVQAPDADLTLLIDESGSMDKHDRWKLAAAAGVCIEHAVRGLRGVRLRVFGFTGQLNDRDDDTVLYRHYDSGVDRLRRPHALGYCYAKNGYTPTGIALAKLHTILRRDRRPGQDPPMVLLISDGAPWSSVYHPGEGQQHAAAEVRRMTTAGIRFAALQIGTDVGDSDLTMMYGRSWRRVTRPAQIPSAVVTLALTYLQPR